MNKVLPTITYLVAFLTSLVFHEMSRFLVWLVFIVALLAMLDKLGKGIALRESIALLYILTCLVTPILGYDYYNNSFRLARVLGYTMRVPESVYFPYAIPAVTAFCFALTFPLQAKGVSDDVPGITPVIARIRRILDEERTLGIVIMFVGLFSFLLNTVLPVSLKYISSILFLTCFASLLYIYYTPNRPNKSVVLLSFAGFIILYSISIGMFTIVIYMGITISSFFMIGKRIALWRKVSMLLTAVLLIIVLQTTKITFRSIVFNVGTDNKVELFGSLFADNLRNATALQDPEAFWSIYLRTNQGLIISNVMSRFPMLKPHDDGKVLIQTVLASFIPRFLWPDKPTADGRFNMRYYAGKNLNESTSMNVGPLGEAYASFGMMGGITFIFLIGIFVRWIYGRVFVIARRMPLIVLWIPVMFYQITYSAETDTMQILNSLIKISFMMVLINAAVPRWFGRKREKAPARRMALGLR
jgi:hypothetical protein